MNFQTKEEALSFIYGAILLLNRLAAQRQLAEQFQESVHPVVESIHHTLGLLDYAGISKKYRPEIERTTPLEIDGKFYVAETRKIDLFWHGKPIAVITLLQTFVNGGVLYYVSQVKAEAVK